MKTYVEIAQEWGSEVDVEAANDDDEIEIFGATGNFYIYIKSWNKDVDEIEAEIYNKITLPNEEEGARAAPSSWPSTYDTVITDGDDGVNPDVEILTLGYAVDSNHIFFKVVTEANFDTTDSTIAVFINDVSNTDQTFEAACTSYTASSVRGYMYEWTSEWEQSAGGPSRSDNIRVNNGFSGIELALSLIHI